jgi:septal ring factor EnvC (AmiA/AmiB activator)
MGAAVPDLDRAAHNLTRDLTQLIALRQTIRDAEERHRSDTRSLDSEKARLASLIGRKAELQQRAALGAQEHNGKLVKLVAEAASLKDLMERLDAARKKDEAALAAVAASTVATFRPPEIGAGQPMIQTAAPAMIPLGPSRPNTIRPFAAARGNFLLPAAGKLVVNFGQNDPQGIVNKGLTYETRAGAQVVAPFDGRIAYAGSFRGYGQILIIEHGDGYHSLLAGLDKVEGAAGQWLVAGEPVGTMPGADGPPRLYLELRHDGQPVNPLPWLATANEKVSG